jgi:hypothetical protein
VRRWALLLLLAACQRDRARDTREEELQKRRALEVQMMADRQAAQTAAGAVARAKELAAEAARVRDAEEVERARRLIEERIKQGAKPASPVRRRLKVCLPSDPLCQ